MSDFLSLIQNGVNVVGNASSLREKNFGEEIDSRVTIRFNWIILDEHTGFRRDIVCTNFPHHLKEKYTWLVANRYHIGHNTYRYPPSVLSELEQKIGKKPSNGCRLLYLLDHLNIEDVNVYGFDWKETPTLVIKDKPCTPENEHHNYQREKEFCHELIESNKWTLK